MDIQAEARRAARVRDKLLGVSHPPPPASPEALLSLPGEIIPPWVSIEGLNDDQQTMLWMQAQQQTLMVTGGPGTGKTFAVCKLRDMIYSGQMHLPTALIRSEFDLHRLIGGHDKVRLITEYVYSRAELERSLMILCQMGTAATNFIGKGQTFHDALGISGRSLANTEEGRANLALELSKLVIQGKALRKDVERANGVLSADLERRLSNTREGRLLCADFVVVDEYSMVDSDLFAHFMDARQQIRGDPRFGGGCYLFSGDPRQLPPVITDGRPHIPIYVHWHAQIPYKTNWTANIRQARDPRFAAIISKLLAGNGLDADEIKALMSRADNPAAGRPLLQAQFNEAKRLRLPPPVRLFATNASVHHANDEQTHKPNYFSGPVIKLGPSFTLEVSAFRGTYHAHIHDSELGQVPAAFTRVAKNTFDLSLSRAQMATVRDTCRALFQRTKLSREWSDFKLGMPVRLKTNVNVRAGLANGTPATLHDVLGDMGVTGTFHGGIYDIHTDAAQTLTLERLRWQKDDGGTIADECPIHTRSIMQQYDKDYAAWIARAATPAQAAASEPVKLRFDATLDPDLCTCSGLLVTANPDTCPYTTIIPYQTAFESVDVGQAKLARVVMKYCPVIPACARTIHSTQGQTYTRMSMSLSSCRRKLSQNEYPNRLAITGLTRVTTLNGLVFEKGSVWPEMFMKDTADFNSLWPIEPEILKFCTFPHPLLTRFTNHPLRTKWLEFHMHDAARANTLHTGKMSTEDLEKVGCKRPRVQPTEPTEASKRQKLAEPPAPAAASAASTQYNDDYSATLDFPVEYDDF
jgi:hypothetical protein